MRKTTHAKYQSHSPTMSEDVASHRFASHERVTPAQDQTLASRSHIMSHSVDGSAHSDMFESQVRKTKQVLKHKPFHLK